MPVVGSKKVKAAEKEIKEKVSRKKQARPIKYPKKESVARVEDPITAEDMKEILGWKVLPDKEGALLQDKNGEWIVCLNNLSNRPLHMERVEAYIQEHLTGRWQFNGEAICISKYGSMMNGQHRGLSLILADQIVRKYPKKYESVWPGGIVTMQTVLTYGVEETQEVKNTYDTGMGRTVSDDIYVSSLFSSHKKDAREALCRMAEYAVDLLWKRTWAGSGSPLKGSRRQNTEKMDFLARHPRIEQCCEYILYQYVLVDQDDVDQAKGNRERAENTAWARNTARLGAGYAAGLLYLMSASNTHTETYIDADPPREGTPRKPYVNWEEWARACEFWSLLCDLEARGFQVVRKAFGDLVDEQGRGGTLSEKIAVLIKAWKRFKVGAAIRPSDLKLSYEESQKTGKKFLADFPAIGGIDRGVQTAEDRARLTPQDVEDEKEKVDQEKEAKKAASGGQKGNEDNGESDEWVPSPARKGKGRKAQASMVVDAGEEDVGKGDTSGDEQEVNENGLTQEEQDHANEPPPETPWPGEETEESEEDE